jgi:predicted nucleic acid-binding protein
MSVLIDTPVWSEFFRRTSPSPGVRESLKGIIDEGDAALLGPIRQEILSGVKDTAQFGRLRSALRVFPNEPIRTSDYENAATYFNVCRAKGVQGSNTDFLICAVALRLEIPIFTLDRDFELFASLLPIRLYRT